MASTPGSSVYVDRQSESPHLTDTKEEISALDMPLPDSGVVDLHHEDGRFKSLKRKRRHFSPEQRKEIQLVRAMGACDNCRKRKLKCSPDHHRTHDGAHSVRSGSVETTHRPLQILSAFAQISQSETPKERETVDSRVSQRESPMPLLPRVQESAGSTLPAFSSTATDQLEQPERQYSNEPGFISLGVRNRYLIFEDQIPHIRKFAEDLNKAVSAAWPKRSASRYSAVNVLMLRWETDKDPIVDGEMSELAGVFSRLYRFNVDTFLIPPEKPQRMLTMKIMRFLEDDNPDTLQIVYYNGHSFLSANRETIWSSQPSGTEGSNSLSLPAIQAFLEESSSDVLLLLDTCETVLSGTVSGGSTVMELLASSGFNVKGKNRSRGFTRSLIEELIGRVTGPPFSTAELHVALLRWMQTRPPDDVERNPPPLYMVLTKPSRLRQSIFLSPIPKALSSIDTDERPGPAESSASGATAFSDTSSYSSRVLVSIKLKDGLEEKLDLDAWKEWLRSMPPEAKNVKIRAAISSP